MQWMVYKSNLHFVFRQLFVENWAYGMIWIFILDSIQICCEIKGNHWDPRGDPSLCIYSKVSSVTDTHTHTHTWHANNSIQECFHFYRRFDLFHHCTQELANLYNRSFFLYTCSKYILLLYKKNVHKYVSHTVERHQTVTLRWKEISCVRKAPPLFFDLSGRANLLWRRLGSWILIT